MISPEPPALSELVSESLSIEQRGVYTNYGPINTALEEAFVRRIFYSGHCLTVTNATCGLMLAIKQATICRPGRRYAVMPSFTFAATAHAALWAGLVPILCDIDPLTWLACAESERKVLEQYGDQIAVILPCATFGLPFDSDRYRAYESEYGCATVVDAAAALGTRVDGRQFTIGGGAVSVFSLHATKTFATHEGGVLHSGDAELIGKLRAMGNFGFVEGRAARMPGFNTKLSEVSALVGLAQIERLEGVVTHRMLLSDEYRKLLPDFVTQPRLAEPQAFMFYSLLLPRHLGARRANSRRNWRRRVFKPEPITVLTSLNNPISQKSAFSAIWRLR